jgi:hypothetical protein
LTLSFDIRRAGVLGLTLLFVLAVVGPACLLFASSAMAMPSHNVPASGCDSSGDPSLGVCPHEDPLESNQGSARTLPQIEQIVVAATNADGSSSCVATPLTDPSAAAPPGPVAHLTPLRL